MLNTVLHFFLFLGQRESLSYFRIQYLKSRGITSSRLLIFKFRHEFLTLKVERSKIQRKRPIPCDFQVLNYNILNKMFYVLLNSIIFKQVHLIKELIFCSWISTGSIVQVGFKSCHLSLSTLIATTRCNSDCCIHSSNSKLYIKLQLRWTEICWISSTQSATFHRHVALLNHHWIRRKNSFLLLQ